MGYSWDIKGTIHHAFTSRFSAGDALQYNTSGNFTKQSYLLYNIFWAKSYIVPKCQAHRPGLHLDGRRHLISVCV